MPNFAGCQFNNKMKISVNSRNLTVSVDLPEEDVTCKKAMLAAYEAITHIFSHSGMVRAYYETDPYYGTEREPDDPVSKLIPEYIGISPALLTLAAFSRCLPMISDGF